MKFRVVLIKSDEGYSISCPMLPGCVSQGATEDEALDNIRSAIREWLGVEESDPLPKVMEAEVTV